MCAWFTFWIKEKRKELMIIYGEDLAGDGLAGDHLAGDHLAGNGLAGTGFTAAELSEGGKAHDRWPGIADALLERARKRITIEPRKP